MLKLEWLLGDLWEKTSATTPGVGICKSSLSNQKHRKKKKWTSGFRFQGQKKYWSEIFNLFDIFLFEMCRNLIRLILHLLFQFSHHQSAWTRTQAFLDALVCPVGGVVSDTKIVQKVEWFQSYTPGKIETSCCVVLKNPVNKLKNASTPLFSVCSCISQLVVCWISSMKHRQLISPSHSELTK